MLFTSEWVKPDSEKVKALTNIKPTKNKDELNLSFARCKLIVTIFQASQK